MPLPTLPLPKIKTNITEANITKANNIKRLTTAKVRSQLAKINFTTDHAKIYKANAIAHLLTYERSVANGSEIDLSALFAVYCHLAWLSDHVHLIHDKRVPPPQRIFLADALAFIFNTYEKIHTD
ncbi:hypothetical protein MOMA_00050 [Moraxella macacae 0408225]|uniref:Uncharacterized protein n=1 Tax=Moraxella macacae 0408225 TaxID=1230338 RepID=L2F8G4_9GAMM|nr:hypothetical protein [Moraxella macacae]ELA08758.1 hypothetical protein MOMA_00050 [Moraxella macacae 0408225]